MNWYKDERMKKLKLFLVCIFCLGLTVGCSSTKEAEKTQTAEELYNQAHDDLDKTAYKKAAETFEKVELEYPYSKWATKAKIWELMLITKTKNMMTLF